MALLPPPIQSPTTDSGNPFTQVWIKWLTAIKNELDIIDGGSA